MKANSLRFLGSKVQKDTVETFTVAKCSYISIMWYNYFSYGARDSYNDEHMAAYHCQDVVELDAFDRDEHLELHLSLTSVEVLQLISGISYCLHTI